MDFGKALNAHKEGMKVTREGWKDHNLVLSGVQVLCLSHEECPYLTPWYSAPADVLADDWIVV